MRTLIALLLALSLTACTSTKIGATGDPITDLSNPDLPTDQRLKAIDKAWLAVQSGAGDRDETRNTLKAIVWSRNPDAIRIAALNTLISDTDPEGVEDTRKLVRLRLPTEPSRSVVTFIADAAVEHGWADAVPALVQSWARPDPDTPDDRRAERRAIAALVPDRPVAEVVFRVFLDPPMEAEGGRAAEYLQDKMRRETWELLSRIDRTGELRARVLAGAESFDAPPESQRILDDLRACYRELGCVPFTADELRWLASLRAGESRWWSEAAAAIASLDETQRAGLRLCHAEPIRWAAEHRPEWLAASREELTSLVDRELASRQVFRRTRRAGAGDPPIPESIRQWRDVLRWPDLLALLVADEAIRSSAVRAGIFHQTAMDRDDTTTEYGGIITAAEDGFVAVLYPPRPAQRVDDFSFTASTDMLRDSDHALLHYHFHAQTLANAAYAGPSREDVLYAAEHGRNCVVFTSIRSDQINADFYCPAGAVIDLGLLTRPTASAAAETP